VYRIRDNANHRPNFLATTQHLDQLLTFYRLCFYPFAYFKSESDQIWYFLVEFLLSYPSGKLSLTMQDSLSLFAPDFYLKPSYRLNQAIQIFHA
jgi:hypothetical protein